jgi:hypothetical protein
MLAITALVFSCKKDDKKSNADLIQGKWNATVFTDNDFYSNAPHRDTMNHTTGELTLEFQSNGKLITTEYNIWKDTSTYKVDGSKLYVTDKNSEKDTFNINAVSGTDLQLYSKEVYNASEYYEATFNFKK